MPEIVTEETLTPEALAIWQAELLKTWEGGAIEWDWEEIERTIDAIVSYHPSVGTANSYQEAVTNGLIAKTSSINTK